MKLQTLGWSCPFVLVACSQGGDPEGVAQSHHEIVNGNPVANPQDTDVVRLVRKRPLGTIATIENTGSGTLIRNDWVLTAAHVVNGTGTVEVYHGNSGDKVPKSGTQRIVTHPEWDVALVRTDDPFTVNGSTTGHVHNISTTAPALLLNAPGTVQCFGYGRDACNGPLGVLREATFSVASSPARATNST